MTLWRNTLRRLPPVAAALAVALAAACGEEPSNPVAADALRLLDADAVSYGMKTYLTTDGIRTGEVFSDSAYQFNDSSRSHLFGMRMKLFHDDGRDRAVITADSAVLYQQTQELTARGNVVAVVQDQGVQIESPELHYNPDAERIWSDSASVLTRDGSVTRGSCFESDLVFENWSICDPVGDIPSEDGSDPGRSGSGAGL